MTVGADWDGGDAPLVGRDAELSWLGAWYRRAVSGSAGRVLLVGPGGIGKTVLLDTFVARATGAVVVRVDADADPRPGAFLALVHAAFGLAATGRQEPDEAASQLLAALGAQQDHGPVVLVLHDVQDVDDVSAHVLARTFRRLRHDRVLLAATARSGGLSSMWSRLFADGPDAATRCLHGLDPPAVRELAERLRPARWSRAALARLHGDTAGHPLHLTTLLRELPDEALLGEAPLPAPRSLADDVAAATGRLSDDARRLLAVLAVLGSPASRSVLARFDTLAAVRLDLAARELAAAGLADGAESGTQPALRVHHPLVRAAVYDALDPDERRRLHLDAAGSTGGAASLAHRVHATEGRPDPLLAEELEASALADPADTTAAATRLLTAAEISATGAEAERRLLAAGVLLVDAVASERLLAIAPDVRAANPCPERDVVLGYLLSLDFDPRACLYLQNALDAADGDAEVRALAGVRLALEHIFRGRGSDADAAAAAVPALTRRPIRVEQAAILRAVGRAQTAGPEEGLMLLDGHLDTALGADPAITAGTLHLAAGRIAEARARTEEGLARARQGAPSTSTHRAHCHLVEILFRAGRWDLAEAEAEVALEWFADGDRPWAESLAHAVAAFVPAARGVQDRAEKHLDAARLSLERTYNLQGAHALALAEATLRRALGDPAAMERAVRDLPRRAAGGGMSSGPFAPWRAIHAEALVETGDLAGARRALRSWPRTGAPLWSVLARHQLQARLALASGDEAGAETALRAGIAVADQRGVEIAQECPVELAELRVLLGSISHVSDGAHQLAAARSVFAALDATPWLQRIDSAQERPAAPGHESHALTARERQVAELVAQGMTSREAAEVLWVTPKAVDYHLGNVYAKLGISSRRQLRGRSFS